MTLIKFSSMAVISHSIPTSGGLDEGGIAEDARSRRPICLTRSRRCPTFSWPALMTLILILGLLLLMTFT